MSMNATQKGNVQSTRDNAGDLLLYWLITEDPRGTI